LPDLGRWQRDHASDFSLAVISRGGVDTNRAKAAEHAIQPFLLQRDYEVADAYLVYGTPGAVLVRGGMIASPMAGGPDQIRALVAHTLGGGAQPWAPPLPLPMVNGHAHDHARHQWQPPAPPAVRIGEPAPQIVLPGLDGDVVDLATLGGSEVLVLFWSPGCGFCQQMLPDLKAWEADPPPGAPSLLVISAGTTEENRALGLRAPVVLDQTFQTGQAFGADGTPSAVVIDADGSIASDLAVGAQAVLRLAGASERQTDPSTTS
jgi:protein-disulfide isomerase